MTGWDDKLLDVGMTLTRDGAVFRYRGRDIPFDRVASIFVLPFSPQGLRNALQHAAAEQG